MNTLDAIQVNDPNNLDEVFAAMRDEMLSGQEYPLRPITPPRAHKGAQEVTADQRHQASGETPTQSPYVANTAANESGTPSPDAHGFDFSKIDNQQTSPDDVRELPIWGLSDEMRRMISHVSDVYQCSRDFVVASMYAAAATMVGKRVSWEIKNGAHKNYATLWIAIVGNSASGKTAPISFFFKPINSQERITFDAYLCKKAEWELKMKNRKKGDTSPIPSKPEWHHYVINNPTDESVLGELFANGSICWLADELCTIFDGFGQYNKKGGGAIVGNLLSIFNNKPIAITRATSEPKYLPEPNLNIIGGTQPSVLKRIMGETVRNVDGLFQRFLIVFPEAMSVPEYSDKKLNNGIAANVWEQTIERLSRIESIELTESARANELRIAACNRWRSMCNSQYKGVDAMIALLRKLEIHLCRWCVVTAVLLGEKEITADVMRYSIECMDYFLLCGEKAFCLIANGDMPREQSNAEILRLLTERYPNLNQSKLADAIGVKQPYISKVINK